MLKKILFTLPAIAGAACLLSNNALAGEDIAPGLYMLGQVGGAHASYDNGKLGINSNSGTKSGSLAGRVALGYQFDPNWAVEVGYAHLGRYTAKNVNGGAQNATVDTNAMDVTWKGILPFTNGFDMFGKVGYAHVSADPNQPLKDASSIFTVKHDVNSLLWGVGFGYSYNRNINLNIAWTRYVGSDEVKHTDFYTAGVAYHFDGVF